MTEDPSSAIPPSGRSSPSKPPPRRSLTLDERHRPNGHRFSTTSQDLPSSIRRRRSSDFSLRDARRSFQSSTDSLLLPRPSANGNGREKHESSHWDSAPLAFALLPAVGGMVFTNGGSVVTDVMLLGLAAVFLNWSLRVPWQWYHSAQEIREKEEFSDDLVLSEESEEGEDALSFSQVTLEEVPEDSEPSPSIPKTKRIAHEKATNELYKHEIMALLSCFLFPMLGAYLLHTIRTQLSRPSEGLVSDYNLTIFLLAAEIRPMAHLVKLIQARTLHLQKIVNSNPHTTSTPSTAAEISDLTHRLNHLETLTTLTSSSPQTTTSPTQLPPKERTSLISSIRQTLQPELDALNRAVRRYEKRATLQAFQTDSRLQELEGRLNDAISLAAAAAREGGFMRRGFTGVVVEWFAAGVVVPVQVGAWVVGLPWRMVLGAWAWVRSWVGQGKKEEERDGRDGRRRVVNGNGINGRVGGFNGKSSLRPAGKKGAPVPV